MDEYVSFYKGKESDFEKCVACGSFVPVPKVQSIYTRKHYITGVGQLCTKCFNSLYNRTDESPSL